MRKQTLVALVAGLSVSAIVWGAREENDPVYVGSRVCGSCHDGKGMGHQFSHWLLSKHARAYALLAKPESKEIARLSGIQEEPQNSPMCLGCHATGAEAEAWEKDDTFSIEDGVQCEKCHGPGSEYMDDKTMRNKEAAARAGLITPTSNDCMNCHLEKGSHVAIRQPPPLDLEQMKRAIAHPTAKERTPHKITAPPAGNSKVRYAGVMACASCHNSPEMGYMFSKWRMSAHANAYASLSMPAAYSLAAKEGLKTPPQESPACLECHATAYRKDSPGALESCSIDEGVGCEACHGAGSEHAAAASAKDRPADLKAGLAAVSKATCQRCHRGSHVKPLDYDQARKSIAHKKTPSQTVGEPRYKTPLNMALSPDGRQIYVACEASDSVVVIDVATRKKVAEIPAGRHPIDVAFSPDGKRAYVSNRFDDTVSVVDVAAGRVISSIPVGDEPHGLLVDRWGRNLYVLNTSADSISVIDLASLKEIKRLSAGRSPWSLSCSPDGKRILVTSALSHFVKYRAFSMSEVTVIDTERIVVIDRAMVPAANLMQGVAWHPGGRFALFTLNRTKNLVPMTRLLQGWTISNGMGIRWDDGRVDQVLLDEPGMCFPDATDVAFTPDGRFAFVTSSGSDRVAVVDVTKLTAMLEAASERERSEVFPNHLGKATEFVIAHIKTKNSPRGIIVTPDGKTVYVANTLDDSLTVIDVPRLAVAGRVDLGGPEAITKVRFGERLFHSAGNAFHRQFSCGSCHPDGHIEGITYDIEPDGIGISPVDNRTLRGILDTAPFKWEGTNPSLSRQCGARLAVFFTRIQPVTPEQLSALVSYICTIPRPPNRYRPLGAELTPAQRRGKRIFVRAMTNDGRDIPRGQRCITCHPPPLYTDRQRHVVGKKMWLDHDNVFDTPHLNNIYDSAPYLHNGIAQTLEEIWTKYNPDDEHGVTNDLTKDQLNDLIEYIKTL